MKRHKLNSAQSEYIEAGEEPHMILTTGRLGRGEVTELHVWILGDMTIVAGHGQRTQNAWAFDEILTGEEVMREFESARW